MKIKSFVCGVYPTDCTMGSIRGNDAEAAGNSGLCAVSGAVALL